MSDERKAVLDQLWDWAFADHHYSPDSECRECQDRATDLQALGMRLYEAGRRAGAAAEREAIAQALERVVDEIAGRAR